LRQAFDRLVYFRDLAGLDHLLESRKRITERAHELA